MTDSNERWADSREKSTERYGDIKDSTALGGGSDVIGNLDALGLVKEKGLLLVIYLVHCPGGWVRPVSSTSCIGLLRSPLWL